MRFLLLAILSAWASAANAAVDDIEWNYKIGERWVYQISDTGLWNMYANRELTRTVEYMGLDTSSPSKHRFTFIDRIRKCEYCMEGMGPAPDTVNMESCLVEFKAYTFACPSLYPAFGGGGTMTSGSTHFRDNQDSGSGRILQDADLTAFRYHRLEKFQVDPGGFVDAKYDYYAVKNVGVIYQNSTVPRKMWDIRQIWTLVSHNGTAYDAQAVMKKIDGMHADPNGIRSRVSGKALRQAEPRQTSPVMLFRRKGFPGSYDVGGSLAE